MIMIVKTLVSQMYSPVVGEKRKEGVGRGMRDLHKDTWCQVILARKTLGTVYWANCQ